MEYPPLETPVIVTMDDGTKFKAIRIVVSDDVGDCTTWATFDEFEPKCPACWDNGTCWASNEMGEPSRAPISWRAAPRRKYAKR